MMHPSRLLVATCIAIFGIASTAAQNPAQNLETLKGTCALTVSTHSDDLELRLEHGDCPPTGDRDRSDRESRRNCHSNETQEPTTAFAGFLESDLGRDGVHVDAVLTAEAGTISCSGTIHNFKLSGNFTFTPNPNFAAHLLKLGILGVTSQNMETYTLFHIDSLWLDSLQKAGVSAITASNLVELRVFKVDAPFVESLHALGYQPSVHELVQLRIFKITPEFIQSIKTRGFGSGPQDLTIAKLVKIKIFKLAD